MSKKYWEGYTTIRVQIGVKQLLEESKLHKREPLNDVLKRKLNIME